MRYLLRILIWNVYYLTVVFGNLYEPILNNLDNFVINENTVVGTNVFNLTVTNPKNRSFRFAIIGTDIFSVDSLTGFITVEKPLDREENDQISFSIQLLDKESKNVILNQHVTVIVSDENDNQPIFQNVSVDNTIYINENIPINTIIMKNLIVTDIDQKGDDLEVTCPDRNWNTNKECAYFDINTLFSNHSYYVANIVLREELDYRVYNHFQLTLRAFDGDLENFYHIQIYINDVQNRPPEFTSSLTVVLKEDVLIHTSVINLTARDGDFGNPRPIKYKILKNPNEYFTLNETSGEIKTTKFLDREQFRESAGILTVIVKAIEVINNNDDVELNEISTIGEVEILLKDINDEIPKFNQKNYFIEIAENISNNTVVPNLNIFVSDLDMGNNSVFVLELDDLTKTFTIEPENKIIGNGLVSLRVKNSQLDFENPSQRKFIVLIKASEIYTKEKFSSSATIVVNLKDVNDNVPNFSEEFYKIEIKEDIAVNQSIGRILASDLDSDNYGNMSLIYELFGYGSNHFYLNNQSGEIFIAQCSYERNCLDYETNSMYYLSYKVTDSYGFGLHSIVPLYVILKDVNDNPPRFLFTTYTATIDEDSSTFDPEIRLEARDLDTNPDIQYFLKKTEFSDFFIIDNYSGIFSVNSNKTLANIHKRSIELKAIATDGLYETECLINVNIRDVNNNEPKFEQSDYFFRIKETIKIGEIVALVKAIDKDDGENAHLNYRILKGAFETFEINQYFGEIKTIRELDYDKRSIYNLLIIAFDNGKISLTGSTSVHIEIENINNKSPIFDPKIQQVQVVENIEIGQSIYQLKAYDPDTLNSNETKLNFSIDFSNYPIKGIDKEGNDIMCSNLNDFCHWFKINSLTGQVIVNRQLNRNLAAIVNLTVLVQDLNAINDQVSSGTLFIIITNVNKYAPMFKSFQQYSQGIYNVLNSPNILNTQYLSHVTNMSSLYININEEEPIGTKIGCFLVDDVDSEIDSYSFETDNDYFDIERLTGCILTKKRLDYETIQSFDFKVKAIDNGKPQLTSNIRIIINLTNVNDMSPIFKQNYYNISLNENPIQDQFLIQVEANDADFGEFGLIEYNLRGSFVQNFHIDRYSGNISVKNVTFFDRESIEHVTIYAVATDKAPNLFKSTTVVPIYITILDVNDNSPIFTKSLYHIELSKNIIHNNNDNNQNNISLNYLNNSNYNINDLVPLIQVQALDLDEGIFGEIDYKIIEVNFLYKFQINHLNGFLYLKKSQFINTTLSQNEIKFQIEGRDEAGFGPHYNRTTILISLFRENSFRPQFRNPNKTQSFVSIWENLPSNSFITNVSAIDFDNNIDNDPNMNDNAKIAYYFKVNNENVEETEEFFINKTTGELRTKISLDREKQSEYEILLVAKDHGLLIAYETLQFLIIKVRDVNDNEPKFLKELYKFYIEENLERNLRIGQILAIDADNDNEMDINKDYNDNMNEDYFDLNVKQPIYYHIINGNENGDFFIDKTDGTLYANRSFDREEQSEYHLEIIATNNVSAIANNDYANLTNNISANQFNKVMVIICIEDVNDNKPIFEFDQYFIGVEFNMQIYEHILQIQAFDLDFGLNGSIRYFIRSSNFYKFSSNRSSGSVIPSPFLIDQNGFILIATPLIQYNQGRFVLDIVAEELVNNLHQAVTQVYIWIYELSQSVRIIFSKDDHEIRKNKKIISNVLSNITQHQFVVGKIQQYISSSGTINHNWSEMYLYAINESLMSIVPVDCVLKNIDNHYDILKAHYLNYSIQNIIPTQLDNDQRFHIASISVFILSSIIFIGIFITLIVFFCLKDTTILKFVSNNYNKPIGFIKNTIFDQLNTTENPLWIEQKLKLYEEQELTMQVFNENELSPTSEQKQDHMKIQNTYATLEHPSSNQIMRNNPPNLMSEFFSDSYDVNYATLLNQCPSNQEITFGFNGSTFQVTQDLDMEK